MFGRIPNGMCSSIVMINHYQLWRDLSNYSFTRLYFYVICIRLLKGLNTWDGWFTISLFWLITFMVYITYQYNMGCTYHSSRWFENWKCIPMCFFLHHTDLIAWGKNWATSSFISLHDKSCDFSYIYLWQSDYKIWDYKLIVVTTRKMPKTYLNKTNIFLPMAPVSWKVYGNGNKIG